MSSTQRSGASGTTGWSLSTKAAEAKHNKKKGVRRESKDLGKPQGWKSRFKAMVVGRFRKLNAAAEERHRQRLMQKREALRLLRRRIDDFDNVTFWKRVTEPELTTWSLRELRVACATRGLRQEGPKELLIQRLMREVWRDKKAEERERIMKALQDQREAEASGTVYCVGVGYGEEKQSPERPMVRKNLTILQHLSGKGVLQVAAGFDATICYAVTEEGDVWTWGEVRPDELAPLGIFRNLTYVPGRERDKMYNTDYDFRRPKLDGTGPVGKEPRPVQTQRFRPRRPMEKIVDDDDAHGGAGGPDDYGLDMPGSARSGGSGSASQRSAISGARGNMQDAYEAVLKDMEDPHFIPPTVLPELRGEDIVSIAPARTHVLALSDGGDVFVWGAPDSGMLGLGAEGNYQEVPKVVPIDYFKTIQSVAVGTSHSVALTTQGELIVWGLSKNGRLGLGKLRKAGPQPQVAHKRFGFEKKAASECVSVPTSVLSLLHERKYVREVACGAAHTMALTAEGCWSWGNGDGGRLGHGDTRDREVPTLIRAFKKEVVVAIAAGAWHSAAIVQQPPQRKGGWLYTWGAGYVGQLAQRGRQVSPLPRIVDDLVDADRVVVAISCGSFHNAALTTDGDVLTWGLNAGNCLGRPAALRHEEGDFFPVPGRVEGLREYGVGQVISMTCGNRFTCIATEPYKVLPRTRVREMARLDLAREKQSQRLYDDAHAAEEADVAALEEDERREKIAQLNVARPLCAQCSKCDGFTPSLFKPMICDQCGHDRKSHTRMRVLGNAAYDAELAAMKAAEG